MSTSPLYWEEQKKYCYLEVEQDTVLDSSLLKSMTDYIQEAAKSGKKSIVCLSPNFQIKEKDYKNFFGFIQKHLQNYVLFVSKEGIRWGQNWKKLAHASFWIAEKNKAIRWVEEGFNLGQVTSANLGESIYIKCLGNANYCIPMIDKILGKVVLSLPVKKNLMVKPQLEEYQNIGVWSYLADSLIFDVAELPLEKEFCDKLIETLRMHNLRPDSDGVFFVTDGHFQTFVLEERLGYEVQTVSNIIRVLPENFSDDRAMKQEVFHLHKACQALEEKPLLITLQVQGVQAALHAFSMFYPDIIIVNELSDANALRDQVHGDIREKMFHITPAADPGVRLLGPQLITQGYDLKLFAEYMISRYKNNRGNPNDTFYYYLNSHPDYLKKVTSFFMMEFAEILSEEYKNMLYEISTCETQAEMQGSYVISVLQDKVLQLDVSLPFTNQGGGQFLAKYRELFPQHLSVLALPLRLFLKGDPQLYPETMMHITEDYNDVFIKEQGFWLESRFQPGKSSITIKSQPDPSLEKRCFSLFTLLNGSEVFNDLPDKELLIAIISMMWENYSNQQQVNKEGFVISLSLSSYETKLKVYQSENNRLMIETSAEGLVSFKADVPFHQNIMRHLLKIIGLLFIETTSEANNWRFACFEAVSKVTSNAMTQNIQVDFAIMGESLKAVFISDSREFNTIPPSSKTLFEKGAEKFHISENGRQAKLLIKPRPGDDQLEEMPELKEMNADNILQEVEDEKAKEAHERSLRFQAIYGKALDSFNKKYGFDEDETVTRSPKHGPKSLEEALRIRRFQSQENLANKKYRKNTFYICTGIVSFLILVTLILMYGIDLSDANQTFILRDVASDDYAITEPLPEPVLPPELPQDPAQGLVIQICSYLDSYIQVNHLQCNTWLKQMYYQTNKCLTSGDFYNVQARLYLYKIYLDKEDSYFSAKWIRRWYKECIQSLLTAMKNYQEQEMQTSFHFSVRNWKPEKIYFPDIIDKKYENSKDAYSDVQALYAKVLQEYKEWEENYKKENQEKQEKKKTSVKVQKTKKRK
jgi:hypothetical protein